MLEILKYCLPALVVLLAAWIVLRAMLKTEDEKRLWEFKCESHKDISMLRLRAYERLVLLLERTTPQKMLIDMSLGEMSPLEVQQQLVRTIRMEHNHNISQQLYVSDEVWRLIVEAQEEMIAFVNAIAAQMPSTSSALDYAKVLITAYSTNGTTTNEKAMAALKEEARSLL